MKMKAYKITRDGESGEWHRAFLGHATAENEEKCHELAIAKFGYGYHNTQVFPVGERVKLFGYLSGRSCARVLRAEFNDMSRDEQDAYANS